MDRFLTLLGTLAWPIATVVIALIFRLDVTRALGRVSQFKFRGVELTFREDLRQAEELARSLPPLPSSDSKILELGPAQTQPLGGQLISHFWPSNSRANEPHEALVEVAERSPRQAVEEAWSFVHRALIRVAIGVSDRLGHGHSDTDAAVRYLVDQARLVSGEAKLVGLLRRLSDRARLDPTPPSTEEARRFVDLALPFAREIEKRS